ncbi:hypothetical protein [Thiomicrospira pelophila]|uniref:hypothetical protein n=1 Tax=Thiomicrospira pelophila TaxID=934 RepID=UPI0012DC9285|nr:hypothetical protein [Thiomicrospira pelophila]
MKKSDAEIANEMAKVKDFKRLANQLSLYDDRVISRIVNGLPPENRMLVRKMTNELRDMHQWSHKGSPNGQVYGRYIYQSTHVNIKRILPSLILALILLSMSGYMV